MQVKSQSNAFTLFELLIAISLASIVFLGLMQTYRNTMASLQRGRDMMHINRKACLLLNQLERDITTAFIPTIHTKNKKQEIQEPAAKEPEESGTQKKAPSRPAEEALKDPFVGTIYETESVRIAGTKYELFKSLSLVNTNPLQIHGQTQPRLVRIVYELILDREDRIVDKPCYKLMRRETLSLDNIKAQEQEGIRSHLVADHVKGMYITYTSPKQNDKEQEQEQEISKQPTKDKEPEDKQFFTWSDQKWQQKHLPKLIDVKLVLWTTDLKGERVFDAAMPIMVYPTSHEVIEDDEPTSPESPNKQPNETPDTEPINTEPINSAKIKKITPALNTPETPERSANKELEQQLTDEFAQGLGITSPENEVTGGE